ncbi:hypothetical protein GEV33_010599 [Tenebrio molitor]|uniref:Uncharacterized protein n=1 Tax=Tenebrio molitor TaxID=7067 RepID=A0A8J6HD00_TENMO|nr:hypothetical protein GEV33_010599 [Tenebrio molitor]
MLRHCDSFLWSAWIWCEFRDEDVFRFCERSDCAGSKMGTSVPPCGEPEKMERWSKYAASERIESQGHVCPLPSAILHKNSDKYQLASGTIRPSTVAKSQQCLKDQRGYVRLSHNDIIHFCSTVNFTEQYRNRMAKSVRSDAVRWRAAGRTREYSATPGLAFPTMVDGLSMDNKLNRLILKLRRSLAYATNTVLSLQDKALAGARVKVALYFTNGTDLDHSQNTDKDTSLSPHKESKIKILTPTVSLLQHIFFLNLSFKDYFVEEQLQENATGVTLDPLTVVAILSDQRGRYRDSYNVNKFITQINLVRKDAAWMLCRGVRDQRDWSGGVCRGKEDKETRPCPDGAHLRVAYRIGWEASPRATRQSISSHTAGSHVPAPPPPGAFLLTRRPNRESPGRCGKALPELGNGFPGPPKYASPVPAAGLDQGTGARSSRRFWFYQEGSGTCVPYIMHLSVWHMPFCRPRTLGGISSATDTGWGQEGQRRELEKEKKRKCKGEMQGTIHFVAVLRVGALLRIHPVPSRRRPPLQAARAVPPAPSHKARSPRMRSHPKSVPKPPCIEASASARVPDDRYGTHPGTIAHLHVSRRWCSRRRHRGRRDSTPSMDELEARRRQVSLSEYCYAAHSPPVRSDFQLTSS